MSGRTYVALFNRLEVSPLRILTSEPLRGDLISWKKLEGVRGGPEVERIR